MLDDIDYGEYYKEMEEEEEDDDTELSVEEVLLD